nr:hypothetical protein [Tanacetum cinerariifolium]
MHPLAISQPTKHRYAVDTNQTHPMVALNPDPNCGGGDDGRMVMTMMLRVVAVVRWWQQGDDEDGDINDGSVMEIVDLCWDDATVGWQEVAGVLAGYE